MFTAGRLFSRITIMVGTYHYTFIQTHRMHNTQSEAQCKLWPWGDNDVSGRFLHGNRCITLVGDVDSGEAYACVGQGVYGKSLYLLLNISMKLRWV